jgi:hypothetical protein
MEIDAVSSDRSIDQIQATDYWREKAACLEKWICELLSKNQELRMDLQREKSLHRQREGIRIAFSPLGFEHSFVPTERRSFQTADKIRLDAAHASCFREECGEIRKVVTRYAVAKNVDPEAGN